MKRRFLFFVFLLGLARLPAYSQSNSMLTPEQRMVQKNSKKKKQGRDADVSKKVKRAKKEDAKARRTKAPKQRKSKR